MEGESIEGNSLAVDKLE
ncbi:hypothetical protein A2U01_0097412, partial [Trifolium medium]|nr:hypothetical protein [Trifolium medium]